MSQTVSPAGLDLPALSRCLVSHALAPAGPLHAELVSGGRSNLTYRVSDGSSRWILRRPPLGHVMPGTHDMGREFRVMAALAPTVVPVPDALLHVEDVGVIGAEFYLMREVPGRVLRDHEDTSSLPVELRGRLSEAMVDTLADLHHLEPHEVGLETLGRPHGYLSRQVERWVRQYHTIRVRELPQVDSIAQTLRATLPTSELSGIIHGDYRIDNVIVASEDPSRIAAVLDWEMATLGDPLADLATLVMFWDELDQKHNPISGGLTAMAGFYTRDDVIERYVSRRGLQVDDVDWYLVFAQFRLAVILEQIHARGLTHATPPDASLGVAEMVPEILDAAEADIAASRAMRRGGRAS